MIKQKNEIKDRIKQCCQRCFQITSLGKIANVCDWQIKKNTTRSSTMLRSYRAGIEAKKKVVWVEVISKNGWIIKF